MARWCQLAAVLLAVSMAASTTVAQDALQTKCQEDLQKLSDCMDYATGHEDTPSAKCCEDTADTQKSRPECLCSIIQQVHSGSHGVQQLGLRFDRLLAQPAACKLPNANVSLCIITPSTAAPARDTADGFKVPTGLGYGVVAAAVVSAVFSSIF
ncbi:hypothetical protein CFC21_102621 [Triticum aestivum]|uniref:Bifunctional inhibitor/plant lipid transfer protein/seed storage helical domain-containing protein n=3 Tax=Triticum TaxID=4564 RepID=A0A9R1A0H4_TRITD|nr:hypothetical protein CFC21_102621 [Triticum aestivum]VAI86515.1 unnamed protein product [Triticum turgidum subsp. durum]